MSIYMKIEDYAQHYANILEKLSNDVSIKNVTITKDQAYLIASTMRELISLNHTFGKAMNVQVDINRKLADRNKKLEDTLQSIIKAAEFDDHKDMVEAIDKAKELLDE